MSAHKMVLTFPELVCMQHHGQHPCTAQTGSYNPDTEFEGNCCSCSCCCIMPWHTVSCCVMLCHAVSCCAMPCHLYRTCWTAP
jgi:hypothetical protein